MKRVHVLGITFLAGFICGLAVPAHADDFPVSAFVYQCESPSVKQVAVDVHQGEGVLLGKDFSGKVFVWGDHDFNKPMDEGRQGAQSYTQWVDGDEIVPTAITVETSDGSLTLIQNGSGVVYQCHSQK